MTNREEVAKKLRENSTVHTTDEAYVVLLNCMGITYDYANLFNRLADLIDPTCKNRQVDINKMAPIEFRADNFICSNCGETFCADKEGVNVPIDWSYCPDCGARVVRDEA